MQLEWRRPIAWIANSDVVAVVFQIRQELRFYARSKMQKNYLKMQLNDRKEREVNWERGISKNSDSILHVKKLFDARISALFHLPSIFE